MLIHGTQHGGIETLPPPLLASIAVIDSNAGAMMPTLTIRDIDKDLKARLRVRAAQNGRSMEAEVRAILRSTLAESVPQERLGSWIHERFAKLGGLELDLPPRDQLARAADFDA